MSIVIEIDNIRHVAVEDYEDGSSCSKCSLSNVCPAKTGVHTAERAICAILEDYDHHFEIEGRKG
jgi:hypothetical protein